MATISASFRLLSSVTPFTKRLLLNRHQPCRFLNLHEYMSQELMAEYGVVVPTCRVVSNATDARRAAIELGGKDVVVKAQVLAGGRGRGHFLSGLQGGVKVTNSPDEVESLVKQMIGSKLVTAQTGPSGKPCSKVIVCEKLDVAKEIYFSLIMHRAYNGPLIMANPQGGINIEEVDVDSFVKDPVDITKGMSTEQARMMAQKLGFSPSCIEKATQQMLCLYKFMLEKDVTMLEINPLVETRDGRVLCLDAKINYDDNAKYRQEDIFRKRDWTQEDPRDEEAGKASINYIGLDGSIGCMVNGAGLAMATMDIIKLYGGSPANFLDIGGGASKEEIELGFRILGTDSNVKAIFVNIFGGILRCDKTAQGITAAAREMNLRTPVVVRLQGNNQEQANKIIKDSNLEMLSYDDFDTAAREVVKIANEV